MPQAYASHFRSLHTQRSVLLLPNAWDAASALVQARAGAVAIGTSSAALCWALGYRDGGALPVGELVSAVRRIARSLKVPLTVDIEDGYSEEAETVAKLVVEIKKAGAVGINIEDGSGSSDVLASKIEAIRSRIDASELFINARTDVYVRSIAQGLEAVSLVTSRAARYAASGADGLFVPGLSDLAETAQIAKSTELPLNLMALPGLPALESLRSAGVRRLSTGPALLLSAYADLEKSTSAFLGENTDALFHNALSFASTQQLFAS